MSRGLTEEPEQSSDDDETEAAIRALILGQNKLHDRLVDLERKFDHLLSPDPQESTRSKKPWRKGL